MAAKMWQQREDLSDLDAISAAWLERGPRSASERVPCSPPNVPTHS